MTKALWGMTRLHLRVPPLAYPLAVESPPVNMIRFKKHICNGTSYPHVLAVPLIEPFILQRSSVSQLFGPRRYLYKSSTSMYFNTVRNTQQHR